MNRGKKCRPIFFTTLLLVIFFTPASADDHFILWKVYAGKFRTNLVSQEYIFSPDTPESREASQNARNGVVVSDISEIECRKNAQFGIIYIAIFNSPSPANFEVTMHYPHLAKEKDGETSHTQRNTMIKASGHSSSTDRYVWTLHKDEMKDGDFLLLFRRDETVFMRHVFKLRGCPSSDGEKD